jgi:lycopene cyclase domain-containing protein
VTYTTAALLGVAATVVLDLLVLRTRLLLRKAFWVAYAIVLGFQLLTNGVLTGRGVVFYADHAVAGAGSVAGERPPFLGAGRIAYAPFEDLLFGFALVVQTLSWWVFWGRRVSSRAGSPR